MPTLRELLELMKDQKSIMLNFDLKAPYRFSPGNWFSYDFDKFATEFVSLIDEYDVGNRVVIESQKTRLLNKVIEKAGEDRKFIIF